MQNAESKTKKLVFHRCGETRASFRKRFMADKAVIAKYPKKDDREQAFQVAWRTRYAKEVDSKQ